MSTVLTAEIDTSPAERSAKAFSNILGGMKSDLKVTQQSVDATRDSVAAFSATVNAARFGQSVAGEAQIVVKSGSSIVTAFGNIATGVKNFVSALGAGLWNGIKTGISGVVNVLGALGAAAVNSFGLFRSGAEGAAGESGGGGGGLGSVIGAALSLKAILVGLAAAGVGFATKLAHDVVSVADDYEDTQKKLESLGLSLTSASDIADRNGATIKTVAGEYEVLSASMVGMHASADQVRTVLDVATQSLKLNGDNSQETTAKIGQLARAFDNGRLSIQEWHDLSISFPDAAKSMQDAIGATDDQMAKLAREGGLHANDFANAIIRSAGSVAEQTGKLGDDFDVAEGRVSRAWTNMIATIADTTGLKAAFTSAENTIAQGLDSITEWFKNHKINIGILGAGDDQPQPTVDLGQDPVKRLTPLSTIDLGSLGPAPRANLSDNGNSRETSDQRQTASLKERIAALSDQNNLLQVGFTENQKLIDQAQVRLDVERATTAEVRAKNPDLVNQLTTLYAINTALKDEQKWQQSLLELGTEVGTSLSTAFIGIANGTLSFKDGIRQATAQIVEMIAQTLILKPLVEQIGKDFASLGSSSGFTSLLSSFFGGLGGGSIASVPVGYGSSWAAAVVPTFASGGVVNSPTLFGHSGGLGLMGEAGPEAIMPMINGGVRTTDGRTLPIGRTSGGHLAVKAFANGGVVGSPLSVGYEPASLARAQAAQSASPTTIVLSPTYHIAGDLSDETRRRLNADTAQIVQAAIAKSTPTIVKQSKAAVARENRENSKYLRR